MVAWMRSVYSTLRPGGRLVLMDFHPLSVMIDSVEPLAFGMPYANDGPNFFQEPGSYAAPDAPLEHEAMVQYSHSLGEILTAAASVGFMVDELVERTDVSARFSRGIASPDPHGRWRLCLAGELLPLLFALRANRPT